MQKIKINQTEIAYKAEGKGNITLLFIHGAFINKDYWAFQTEYFKQYYNVITVDLPGHGLSGKNKASWSIKDYGNDICRFIKALKLMNVILIGHSFAGNIILEVAVNCPDEVIGIIGIDNFKNAGTAMPKELQGQIEYILKMLKSDFANTSESYARNVLLSPGTNTEIADRVAEDYRNMDKDIGYALIAEAFYFYERERELLQTLKHKLYLINSCYMPTNETLLNKYAASGYKLFQIDATCHYPMIENHKEFNILLYNILTTIEKNLSA